MAQSLLSTDTLVEAPFVIVRVGEYTFGNCSKGIDGKAVQSAMNVTFPNFIESLAITKINGTINMYTLRLVYGITHTDDPNLLERVFSSVSSSREITLTYGDWNAPSYIYKEETAIITKITQDVDVKTSRITYTIKCTSTALTLKSGVFNFNARFIKGSDAIIETVMNQTYGFTKVFRGMRNPTTNSLANFIARDDKAVQLEAKQCNPLDYVAYVASCMSPIVLPVAGTVLKNAVYAMSVHDDVTNKYGGEYFKITKLAPNTKNVPSYDTYTVDVGYPTDNHVTSFTLNNNDMWSILYDHSGPVQQSNYSYHLDNEGNLVTDESPTTMSSSKYQRLTESDKTWWTNVTQFPISAKLSIKGLLRPAILMSYVKINTYFYGHKHISSGLYIITKQEDIIDRSGYRTTLTLTRIGGDD